MACTGTGTVPVLVCGLWFVKKKKAEPPSKTPTKINQIIAKPEPASKTNQKPLKSASTFMYVRTCEYNLI